MVLNKPIQDGLTNVAAALVKESTYKFFVIEIKNIIFYQVIITPLFYVKIWFRCLTNIFETLLISILHSG